MYIIIESIMSNPITYFRIIQHLNSTVGNLCFSCQCCLDIYKICLCHAIFILFCWFNLPFFLSICFDSQFSGTPINEYCSPLKTGRCVSLIDDPVLGNYKAEKMPLGTVHEFLLILCILASSILLNPPPLLFTSWKKM